MVTKHRRFLPSDFIEGVLWLVPLAVECYKTRGTAEYTTHLNKLPESYRDSYHLLIQWGVQYFITLFLGMRGIEGTKQLKVKDLVKVDSDPDVEFSYWREVNTCGALCYHKHILVPVNIF